MLMHQTGGSFGWTQHVSMALMAFLLFAAGMATARAQEPRAILHGTGDDVNAVAFSPDGRSLAAAGSDKNIIIFEANHGNILVVLRGHSKPIRSLAFCTDGKTLASGSDEGDIKIWDLKNGVELATLHAQHESQKHVFPVFCLAFQPDGKTLTSLSQDLQLWKDFKLVSVRSRFDGRELSLDGSEKPVKRMPQPRNPRGSSPSDRRGSTGQGDRDKPNFRINNSNASSLLSRWPSASILSSDGQMLVTGEWIESATVPNEAKEVDGFFVWTIKFRSVNTGQLIRICEGHRLRFKAKVSWSGKSILDEAKRLQDRKMATTPALKYEHQFDLVPKYEIDPTPVLTILTGQGIHDIEGSIALAPGGRTLATSFTSKSARLGGGFAPRTGRLGDAFLPKSDVTSPPKFDVTAHDADREAGRVLILDIPTIGTGPMKISLVRTSFGIGALNTGLQALSPDGKIVGMKYGVFYDLEARRTKMLSGQKCVAFSPDGITVATGGSDGNVSLWDAKAMFVPNDPKN